MNNSIILSLIQNVSLLLVFSLIYDYFWSRHKKPKGILFKIVAGIILGGFAILLMLTPWEMMPGVVFDVRSALLVISGLFFGIIPTLIAMITAAIYRFLLAGSGVWMGIAVIISSGTIGIVWRFLRPNWKNKKPALELLALGFLAHIIMLGCIFFLPAEIRILTFNKILLPTLTIYPTATILLGLLMVRWSRNWQNQEFLKAEEKKYRSLLEFAPDAFFHGDSDGNFITVNNKATELTEYTKKELLAMNIKDLFPPTELNEKPLTFEFLQQNHIVSEGKILQKRGGKIIVELKAKMMPDGTFQSFMKDISADKKAEEALKESERNFRLVFENSPIGIYMASNDGSIIDANYSLLNILGSPSIEATKEINVLQFPPLVQNGYADKFSRCVSEGNIIEFQMPYKTNWEKETYLHSFIVPLKNSDGKVEKVYTLINNITERKRIEKGQKAAFNISNAAITTDNLKQLIGLIQKELGTIIDTTNFFLALYDPQTDTLSLPFFADEYDNFKSFPAEKTITRYVIDTQESLLADVDFLKKLENSGDIMRHGEDSLIWLGVPLKVDGKITGAIVVQSYTDENAYNESDQKMLEFISGQIGMVIQNKKAEELLKKSEERFDLAMKASNDGLYDWNLVTNEVYYSTRWKTILGYEENELPNDLSTWENLSHNEEKEASLAKLNDATKNRITHYGVEFRMKHKLGHWVNVLSRAELVYNEEGKVIRAVGTHADLTDQKKAEKNLKEALKNARESEHQLKLVNEEVNNKNIFIQTILDNLPIGVALNNIDGGDATYMNEKFEEIYGWSSEEITNISSFFEKVYPDEEYRNQMIARIMSDIKSGDPEKLHWENIFITRKDKSKRVINSANISLVEQNTMISTVMDITNLHEIQNDLLHAKEKAEESDRLKSAFLANMSHEIRTPMNGILGFADILKQPGLTGSEQLAYIDVIERSGHRMLNIINNIVDISKIESGQMEAHITETNINEQIEFIYTFFKTEAEQKGIQLKMNNSLHSSEVNIRTDREKLYAILTNLVKNAIKYSNEGRIEFGYTLKKSDLQFYVKDTGIGISPDRQEAIFERFIQADIADKMALQGAGLGLTISRAYVEMLGGKIWVESELGKHSKFYFTIPYLREKDHVREAEFVNNAVVDLSKMKLNILIVEDDPTSDIYLTTLAKSISKKIVHAQTGVEAIELCKSSTDFDLILMDIKMPIMNGYEATRKIREFNKDVIIIAQTAYALAGDRKKALEAGCNDYITKPIKKIGFFEMIENYF